MERVDFKIPLLIGGATTSANHTAVKIAPNYKNLVIHLKDASRSVGACRAIMDKKLMPELVKKTSNEYKQLRVEFEKRLSERKFVSISDARAKGLKTDWTKTQITRPTFLGNKVFEDYDLNEIKKYIDWSPFFITWELKGKYPNIFKDARIGEEAKKLFDDAQGMLKEIIDQKLLKANAVIGFYPVNSVGDDIELYTDDKRKKVRAILHTLRQQAQKVNSKPYYALSDFIAPTGCGVGDYLGGFAATERSAILSLTISCQLRMRIG